LFRYFRLNLCIVIAICLSFFCKSHNMEITIIFINIFYFIKFVSFFFCFFCSFWRPNCLCWISPLEFIILLGSFFFYFPLFLNNYIRTHKIIRIWKVHFIFSFIFHVILKVILIYFNFISWPLALSGFGFPYSVFDP
jgi:hypothetical protein